MPSSDHQLVHLELLSRVDDATSRLSHWSAEESHWQPLRESRGLIRLTLERTEQMQLRLESPLVVATFGGTGTGKSTLINALVGVESTPSGRERPTTRTPTLVIHEQTEQAILEASGLPLDELQIVRRESPILRDVFLIDCPDPDTSDNADRGSNLQKLQDILPHCDVLIYTTTQQKYRSARIVEELAETATGCRLLFVQTHADLDDDIREDWQKSLATDYKVPEMFFVDSTTAMVEQMAGRLPKGEFRRLLDVLTEELSASQRVQVRRSNLLDLLHSTLQHSRSRLQKEAGVLESLREMLAKQQEKVRLILSDRLKTELTSCRNLWDRRVLESVTQIWGLSPFSSVLRVYHGLGNLLASVTLFRARSSAQMALIGTMQGLRWLKQQTAEQDAEHQLQQIADCFVDDETLREARLVVSGCLRDSKLDPGLIDRSTFDALRSNADRLENQFFNDAGREVDEIVEKTARRNGGWGIRLFYEFLISAFIAFVLYRIGRNFFYDTFWLDQPHLTTDFYLGSIILFLIWTALLVTLFVRRLKRGISREIETMAGIMSSRQLAHGLFPKVERSVQETEIAIVELSRIAHDVESLRSEVMQSTRLGTRQISDHPTETNQ